MFEQYATGKFSIRRLEVQAARQGLTTRKGRQEFSYDDPPHIQQPLIQTIVDELLGCGSCPSHGESALRTAVVMDKVLEGYYDGRHDAFWERPETWHR